MADLQAGVIESRHIDYVPEHERKGKLWRQGPFWFLGNFQPFTVSIAFLGPVFGLNGLWTSIAGVTGILFGTLFMAAHAAQGPRLGLPQMIQSRAQFGYRGVIIPLVATTYTFAAFIIVDTIIIKQGFHNIYGWSELLVAVAITVFSALTAIYGHDWIHRIFIALFWASLPFWIILTIGVLAHHAGHGTPIAHLGFNTAGFFAVFATGASYNITYAPYVSDYTRYLPRDSSPGAIIGAVFYGAAASPAWLIPLGAWMATQLGVYDAIAGIYHAGNATVSHTGAILAFLAVASLVATMGMGAYSGMLSVITVMDAFKPVKTGKRSRVTIIVVFSLVCFIFNQLLSNATTALNDSLIIMLYLLSPWTAVNLVDFYAVRHGKYAVTELFRRHGHYGEWASKGIIAYFVGILVEIPFMYIPNFTNPNGAPAYYSWGSKALGGVDISWLIGLAVAAGLYWVLTRSIDLASEQAVVARSEAELQANPETRN